MGGAKRKQEGYKGPHFSFYYQFKEEERTLRVCQGFENFKE